MAAFRQTSSRMAARSMKLVRVTPGVLAMCRFMAAAVFGDNATWTRQACGGIGPPRTPSGFSLALMRRAAYMWRTAVAVSSVVRPRPHASVPIAGRRSSVSNHRFNHRPILFWIPSKVVRAEHAAASRIAAAINVQERCARAAARPAITIHLVDRPLRS